MVIRKIVKRYLEWRWGFPYEFAPPVRPTKVIADNGYHFVNKGGFETFYYRVKRALWLMDRWLDDYFGIREERHEWWAVKQEVEKIEEEKRNGVG